MTEEKDIVSDEANALLEAVEKPEKSAAWFYETWYLAARSTLDTYRNPVCTTVMMP